MFMYVPLIPAHYHLGGIEDYPQHAQSGSVIETRQMKATTPENNFIPKVKEEMPQVGIKPTTSAH